MRTSVRHEATTFWKKKKRTRDKTKDRLRAKQKRRRLAVQPGLKAGPKYLTYNGQTLFGIRKALGATFWPKFKHPTAQRKSQFGVTKEIGLRVEEQIWEWVKTHKKPSLNYARLFCAWVRAKRFEIVAAQHPIYDSASGIGTRIDFVLTDGHVYYLVELKVGYNYCFDTAQDTMQIVSDVRCTPRNQCYFQLAWMHRVVSNEGLFDAPVVPLLVVLTNSLVKRAKVGKKPIETLARHLRKADTPKIALDLPSRIAKVAPTIHRALTAVYRPKEPEVIDLT